MSVPRTCLLVNLLCLCLSVAAQDSLPLTVAADDANLHREGRFSADHRFGWTASGVSIRFSGQSVNANLRLTAGQRTVVQVVVDGTPTETLTVTKTQTLYRLATDLPAGEHVVGFRKRPEGFAGELAFDGFQLDANAKLLPLAAPQRRMLVIGDSISCGYGNEATDTKTGNTPENENGYLAYGPIAARAVGADVMMVCWSGRGMYRNRDDTNDTVDTMPTLFERTLPLNPKLAWDHTTWIPDVIVINLGTNDLARGKGNAKPELGKDDYLGAYRNFVDRLRTLYPKATIIAAIGPMALKPISEWLPEWSASMEGVHYLQFDGKQGAEYVAAHWHPSVAMHQIMATTLVSALHELVDWAPLAPMP